MIFIDRTGKMPPAEWSTRADTLTAELLAAIDSNQREKIIDDNQKLWGELKDFLLGISYNKCWYSESMDSYAHLHVDHFRPKKVAIGLDKKDKGGYWWLCFEWTNYRVCGSAGNVRKKDKFAVRSNKSNAPSTPIEDEIIFLLDPCEEEDILKITFNENGEAGPLASSGFDNERSLYTLASLNLNFKLLKEARKRLWVKCFSLISETQSLIDKNNMEVPSVHRRGQIKEKIRQLKVLVHPSAEYSATSKACLLSSGLDWAKKII